VFLATLVSFIVAALIMKFTKEPKQDLEAATAQMEATKGKKSNVSSKLTASDKESTETSKQTAGATGATAATASQASSSESEDDSEQL
ncbi:PTS mannitol transporter subunit IICBA, partial [Staphylococcus epidermidis]